MKAKLIFDLEDAIDKEKFDACCKAQEMRAVIWDFTHNTKRKIDNLNDAEAEGYRKALQDFHDLMNHYELIVE